jgi:hypothetical protein
LIAFTAGSTFVANAEPFCDALHDLLPFASSCRKLDGRDQTAIMAGMVEAGSGVCTVHQIAPQGRIDLSDIDSGA